MMNISVATQDFGVVVTMNFRFSRNVLRQINKFMIASVKALAFVV